MKKANVRISVSGIEDLLMHLEARKDNHPHEALFVTWCKVSEDRYHYGWQLMHEGEIKAADGSADPVSHQQLGEEIERLIENTFVDNTFGHIDQSDFMLMN